MVTMGKVFAVVLTIITTVTVAIFVSRHWWFPQVASAHGGAMDHQFVETFVGAAIGFILAQLSLALFAWKYGERKGETRPIRIFPGGAKWLVVLALVYVGSEIILLEFVGQKVWAAMYFTPAASDSLQVQVLAGQFAFYFRYPGPDGKFGPIHTAKIDESRGNLFGIVQSDPGAKDDIVTVELAVPVNKPVELLLNSKDVGHGFYVPEMRIQQDIVPGMEIPLHFTPTKIGKYDITCNQLCGLGHHTMRAFLEVMSEEDYQKWIAEQASLQ
jgi:cytochrome c oxidase subunit 2